MVVPSRDIKTAVTIMKAIQAKYDVGYREFAKDAGVSITMMYNILNYGDRPRPKGNVEAKILRMVDRLKLKYPDICPQEVGQK